MSRLARRKAMNVVALAVCLVLLLAAVAPLVSVLWQVWQRGHAALGVAFFTQAERKSFDLATAQFTYGGGMAHAALGTLIVVGLGALVGAPFGILAGIYLSEYGRHRAGDWLRAVNDALAGIPSIVAGLFAVALMASLRPHSIPFSGWTGALALALLMVPTVTRATESALGTVPQSLRDGALALGAPRWRTTLRIVLPVAWPSVTTGLLLGVARIAGETAPVLLAAGYLNNVTLDPAHGMPTLPVLIYQYSKSAVDVRVQQGWGAALVLITGVLAVNVLVRLLSRRRPMASQ